MFNYKYILFISILSFFYYFYYDANHVQKKELILVQVIMRHGDRVPAHILPNDEIEWKCFHQKLDLEEPFNKVKQERKLKGNCELGSITQEGISQCNALGKELNKRYHHFLSSIHSFDKIVMETTNFQRTIQSAISFLNGLFNKEMHILDKLPKKNIILHLQEKSLLHPNHILCPLVGKLMVQTSESEEWKNEMKKNEEFKREISKILNLKEFRWIELFDHVCIKI